MAAEWLEAVSGWGGAVLVGLVAGLAWWRLRSKAAAPPPPARPEHGADANARPAVLERHSQPVPINPDLASDVDPATGLHTGSGVVVTHAERGAGAGLAPAVRTERTTTSAPEPAALAPNGQPNGQPQGQTTGQPNAQPVAQPNGQPNGRPPGPAPFTDPTAAGSSASAGRRHTTEALAPRPGDAADDERSTIERALAPGQPGLPGQADAQAAAAALAKLAKPPAAAPVRTETDTAGPPVLVVDDSAVVRAMLRKLLEANGCRVVLARDGLEALAQLDQASFALMITDLEMPNMDGVGLISALSARPGAGDLPILAITGHDDLHDKLSQFESVRGVFRKPWKDSELLGRVASLVQSRQLHSAHGA